MAADDHLSDSQFYYHGTNARIRKGGMIEPGHKPLNSPEPQEHVYMTPHYEAAADWGKHVYMVQPTGPVEPDPHSYSGTDVRSAHPLRRVG